MTARTRTSRLLSAVAGTVAVAGILGVVVAAFALSFDAIRAVAVAAHIRASIAWLFPVAVDGAMSVATVCAVVLRARGRSAAYPWAVVLFGAAVSVIANGLHAWVDGGSVALPAPWAVALSSVPPLLLALSIHLLIVLALSVSDSDTSASTEAEVGVGDADDSVTSAVGQNPTAGEPVTSGNAAKSPQSDDRRPTPTRTPRRRVSTAERVARAVDRSPNATNAELAARLGLSERTIQRYRREMVTTANGHNGPVEVIDSADN